MPHLSSAISRQHDTITSPPAIAAAPAYTSISAPATPAANPSRTFLHSKYFHQRPDQDQRLMPTVLFNWNDNKFQCRKEQTSEQASQNKKLHDSRNKKLHDNQNKCQYDKQPTSHHETQQVSHLCSQESFHCYELLQHDCDQVSHPYRALSSVPCSCCSQQQSCEGRSDAWTGTWAPVNFSLWCCVLILGSLEPARSTHPRLCVLH